MQMQATGEMTLDEHQHDGFCRRYHLGLVLKTHNGHLQFLLGAGSMQFDRAVRSAKNTICSLVVPRKELQYAQIEL